MLDETNGADILLEVRARVLVLTLNNGVVVVSYSPEKHGECFCSWYPSQYEQYAQNPYPTNRGRVLEDMRSSLQFLRRFSNKKRLITLADLVLLSVDAAKSNLPVKTH